MIFELCKPEKAGWAIYCCYICVVTIFLLVTSPVEAQTSEQEEIVIYPAVFFQRYQPNTALDMVQQIPGFQLDDGSNLRGFSGAAGNILINSRRPSAKQDALSAILTRIPASYVERIDLVRGQISGIDLQGQSVIANIILLDNALAAIRWQATVRRNFNNSQFAQDGNISLSDRWRDIDYNAGISASTNPRSYKGPENIYDGSGNLTEQRDDDNFRDGNSGQINLNASTSLGETLVRVNSKLAVSNQDGLLTSIRKPLAADAATRNEYFSDDHASTEFETGFDAERGLSPYLFGKGMLLFYRKNNDRDTSQRVINMETDQSVFYREANSQNATSESIGRLEFDWIGWIDHAVQANVELAYNFLDGSQIQVVDSGAGPEFVNVPGANSRVEEVRWDILLQDTWSLGQFVMNYGLGFERSTISQTGDDNQSRSFFYMKPQSQLTWSPSNSQQTRLRVAREVAQLDFNDFISTSVFEDDDLALGNPNLKPETTWIAEISHELRFGEMGVITLTAFNHWISDVQDLLPLTDKYEVPGNIGDGNRRGVELETTVPLEWLGLTGARLDIKARLQDSSVTDPVTGMERVLSGKTGFGSSSVIPFRDDTDEYEYVYDIAYRQDFNTARLAWGWDIAERAERILFKVNELDIVDESELEFNAFVETTRWAGLKTRLEAQNILNLAETRDRTLFVDTRNSAFVDIERRELRARTKGFRLYLTLSGAF